MSPQRVAMETLNHIARSPAIGGVLPRHENGRSDWGSTSPSRILQVKDSRQRDRARQVRSSSAVVLRNWSSQSPKYPVLDARFSASRWRTVGLFPWRSAQRYWIATFWPST
jgi:hypothetical protein